MQKIVEQKIVNYYINDGKTVQEIARIVNIPRPTVYIALKRNNIKLDPKRAEPKRRAQFSTKQINNIIKDYLAGASMADIYRELNCDNRTIKRILLKNGITLRENFRYKKYDVNETFFDQIDSEEKAYFLGFLYADGCNSRSKRYYRMEINLQERDKYILEKFRDLISPTKPLYFIDRNTPNQQNTYALYIDNIYISNRLNDIGMVAAKSLILTYPKIIPSSLEHHFIRGYFDGDGTICRANSDKNNKAYNYFRCSIVSTYNFCNSVRKIINDILDLNIPLSSIHIENNGITSVLQINTNARIIKFLEWLYKDATIFLTRKRDKLQILKKIKLPGYSKKLNLDKANKIREEYKNEGKSISYLAKQYKVSISNIRKIIHNKIYKQ